MLFLYVPSEAAESKLLKLETSSTVILSQMVSVLWSLCLSISLYILVK